MEAKGFFHHWRETYFREYVKYFRFFWNFPGNSQSKYKTFLGEAGTLKGSKIQYAVILILLLTLIFQMEGLLPDIFAENKKTILFVDEIDGMEFKAQIDNKGFDYENELVIKTIITNKSNLPKSYYSSTASYGVRGVLGAALVCMDKKSSFTDKFLTDPEPSNNSAALEGLLESGRGLVCDFYMLPFYNENGDAKRITPGKYILSLWYNKDTEKVIKAEFPVTIKKRLSKMYIEF